MTLIICKGPRLFDVNSVFIITMFARVACEMILQEGRPTSLTSDHFVCK